MAQKCFDGGVDGPGRIARVLVGDLLRRSARRMPDRVALVDGERQVTYQALDRAANRLAHGLIARGLEPGQRVATICVNSVELAVAIFAIARAGLIWVPINLMLDARHVRFTLDHAGVALALVDPQLAGHPALGEQVRGLGLPVLLAEPDLPAFRGMPDDEPEVGLESGDIAAIVYTSGTTSMPKGAMHSHLSLVMSAMSNALEWRLDRSDGVTLQLPLFHCAAHCILLAHLMVGARAVLMRRFDPEEMLRNIDRHRLTLVVGLPAMYEAMLDHPARGSYSTASLRLGHYAMAPMPEPLMRRMVAEFCPSFTLVSGQTEMYPVTTMSRPERQMERFGNYWGEGTVINDVAVMDEAGSLLPRGAAGELVHRGPNVMAGYYRDPEATAASRRHGWHHTGDIARITEANEVQFLDRTRDMIKTGGENVSSLQVEEQLLACEGVAAAAVVGLPHPHWGEAVTAFVKPRSGAPLTEETVLEKVRDRLGRFQLPKRVVIVDDIPMTATGKLRKVELREAYAGLYREAG